ncbi:hypothetical protein GCM10023347_14810 [Streptomyces chumphonensis]|uniref:Glycosyltransferase n=1 Tax=Streptomyces chumphonensis TaxID=1214925 RepID=A0A927IC01_9ACTN|nr:glycosyltransferase [Streptomyces chumphonensis]MBD3931395.1 glycosyltransferase [Streptomyces chumphonensis]
MSVNADPAPVISIVVPAYNAAGTLGRALDSLAVQTCAGLEVIVVDDASTDATLAVARTYEERLPGLRVIARTTNSGGVGEPRNDGIRAATGDYVMFLDADDELTVKACEVLLDTARSTGADISAGRAQRVNLARGTTQNWQAELYGADRSVRWAREWPELINDPIAAAKLFRRSFLTENEIFFPEGIFYEDTFFSAKAYALAAGISVSSEAVYRWFWEDAPEGAGSITNRRQEVRSIADRIAAHRLADSFLVEHGARELKTQKDVKFLTHDVRLYMKELRTGDSDFREKFLTMVSEYLAEITEEAYALCGPLDRVRAFYLRHGLAAEALTVSDFEQRRSVVSTDIVQCEERVYWSERHLSLPDAERFLDVTELGLQHETFRAAKLFNEVTELEVFGDELRFSGRILNQFRRFTPEKRPDLDLVIRAKDSGAGTDLDLQDVRLVGDHLTYTGSVPLTAVLERLAGQGTVHVLVRVTWSHKRHMTALCVRGRDLTALGGLLAGTELEAYETASGNLAFRPTEAKAPTSAGEAVPDPGQWHWYEELPLPAPRTPAEPVLASVVVDATETAERLDHALHSLLCQPEFPQLDVLVVTDPDAPRPRRAEEIAAAHGQITFVDAGTSATAVAARVRGPYVTFLDGSGILAENAVGRLLDAATRTGSDVVIGRGRDAVVLRGADRLHGTCFGSGDREFPGVADAPDLVFSESPAGKLFRTELLARAEWFPHGGRPSDRLRWVLRTLLRAGRTALVDDFVHGVPEAARSSLPVADRLSLTLEVLRLGLALQDEYAHAEPAEVQVVRRYVAGCFDEYLSSLPKMLTAEKLAELFPEVRELYRSIPEEVILDVAAPRRTRLPHHAVKSGNVELFCDVSSPPPYLPELVVEGDILHRTVRGDREPSTVLRVGARAAKAESLRVVDGTIRVEGFLTLGGVDLSEPLTNAVQLVFRTDRGAEHAVALRQVYRRDRWHVRRQRDLYAGWRADLAAEDLAALHGGSHSLFVRIHGGGTVDVPVTARPALHRFKGVLHALGHRCATTVRGDGTVGLRVARSRSALAVAHAARRVGREAAAIATRTSGWRLRALHWLARPVLSRRDIWLVGERHDTAQDNGYHFFRWVRENRPRRNVYYVIESASADHAKVRPFGNVIARGSLKHRLYLLSATRLVSPYDAEAYLTPPGRSKLGYLRDFGDLLDYRRVFLQHGVTYNDVSQSAHRQSTSVDLFVTVSEDEAEYVRQEMGYRPREVRNLGFPRFDSLRSEESVPTVLLMPTWRRDIVVPSYRRSLRPKVQFTASQYFRFYSRLLADERLRAALEHSGVRLEFFPHYEIRPYLRHFEVDHPSITVADQAERGVQEAMKQCSLLVTDYSSVFFDVAYMNKPLVYVPFDEDEFYGRHYRRGYFDLSRDGFGPVCRTVDAAVEEIIAAIDRKFRVESPYAERVDAFFGRRDTNNSARVFAAIDELDR